MNLERALQIQGWTSEPELRWLAEQASTRNQIVEVGSWLGRSTRAMSDNTTGTICAVDTWNGSGAEHAEILAGKDGDWLFEKFYDNVLADTANVIPYRRPSPEYASAFKEGGQTFDMIFIDAAHDYESVKADIQAWTPLLAPGGLLCGHDFDAGRPGVVQAVKELVPDYKRGPGSLWYASPICELCKHSLLNNSHGFDQNDAWMEGDKLVHSGRCSYCKECYPRA